MLKLDVSLGQNRLADRKGTRYRPGELETILSLVPTKKNIEILSELLDRNEGAIEIVYRIAYGHGPFAKDANTQNQKILDAKKCVGIAVGRQSKRTD